MEGKQRCRPRSQYMVRERAWRRAASDMGAVVQVKPHSQVISQVALLINAVIIIFRRADVGLRGEDRFELSEGGDVHDAVVGF